VQTALREVLQAVAKSQEHNLKNVDIKKLLKVPSYNVPLIFPKEIE